MNTKSLLSILLVSSALFISCKNELEPQDSSDAVAAPAATAANTVGAQPQTQSNQVQPVQGTQVAGALNPAHGQPNHRCDIAVGAPLNSAPATGNATAAPALTASPTPQSTTVMPPQSKPIAVAAGMNPAHGQPNHRCDIAVGAPLSTPVTKATTPVPTTVQPTKATSSTASSAIPATIAATAPGMNPPHGQEGHRCDIAVGEALPKS